MKTEKLSELVSIVANLGVILGIIFLVIEISQNNELLAAQDRFNRLHVAQESGYMLAQDPFLRSISRKHQNNEQLTDDEAQAFGLFWDQIWKGNEWTFRELPREDLPVQRWRNNFGDSEFLRNLWNSRKAEYRQDFVDFFDTQILNY